MLPEQFQTPRLLLRPIASGDAEAIFQSYAQDPDVVRFVSFRPHRSVGDTAAFIAGCLAAPPQRERTYVLIEQKANTLIGSFHLRRRDVHRLDCGYALAKPWWGRGLMTEALSAVAAWAMGQETIWRLGAVCDVDNLASARVMEKSGMHREGILRRWLVHPNISAEPRDCVSYAIVR